MRKGLLFVFLMGFFLTSYAQDIASDRSELLEVRREVFERLKENVRSYTLSEEEKKAIAKRYNLPLSLSLESGKTAHFQYMDEEEHPVYYTTHNVTSAITSGTNTLQSGGSLNLNLEGEGMIVGIYDQTRPRANHNEFGNRVTQVDGSTETISNHATHVTGTILARGNNPSARGMANNSTGWAFNWDADISKMMQNSYDPDLLPTGHLISNHSYGILVGWYRDSNGNWSWAGNESISPNEDYRFGFYTSKSRQLDELAFAKPYYTVVWAAGNDRNDVGDGSRDSDGPEDSIGPEGVAKNNIVVGAVNGITNYTGPNSVVMSSFSSWGPVDDGRIKPDLVAMGVNVFSTAVVNDGEGDGYASLSGTSMAAPNVSGSLLLLQELYHSRNAGRYMRSATLKALAIQTSKAAGMNRGPDYMHGWGLIDAEASAKMVMEEDGSSQMIRELVLENEQTYEFEFVSNGIDPVKATIAWTDPPGSSPSPSLNPRDLMLVNDLDLRIIDEEGNVFYPWSLNPADGVSAVAVNSMDNFRDNVEQIWMENPQAQKYKLQVTHKGSLRNNRQPFSLVFSAGVEDGQANTLYWIGEDGNWSNPSNWSTSNNGQGAGIIPDEGTRVVIDRPISAAGISLSENSRIFSLNIFGDNEVDLDLNGFDLVVESGFRSSNESTIFKNGSLHFLAENELENLVDFGLVTLQDVPVHFSRGRWRIITAPHLQQLSIQGSRVNLDMENLSLGSLLINEGASFFGRNTRVSFSENIEITEEAEIDPGFSFRFTGTEGTYLDSGLKNIQTLTVEGQRLHLLSVGSLQRLQLNAGTIVMSQERVISEELEMQQGITLEFPDGHELQINNEIQHHAANSSPLTRFISAGKGRIVHEPYRKYCFENIVIQNVDLLGQSIINLGPDADIVNGLNWRNMICENVLFVNFEARFNCAGGLTEFVNTTEGNVTAYSWNFGNLGASTERNPTFIFDNARTYTVALEVTGPGGSMRLERQITISSNTLSLPSIVNNGAQLTSRLPAPGYQWYRNGSEIENATGRSFMVEDGGSYQVAVIDGQCNRLSEPVVISSLENEPPLGRLGYFIGPNPWKDKLSIRINNAFMGKVTYEIYSSAGILMDSFSQRKEQEEVLHELELNYPKGFYLLLIKTDKSVFSHKLLKD